MRKRKLWIIRDAYIEWCMSSPLATKSIMDAVHLYNRFDVDLDWSEQVATSSP